MSVEQNTYYSEHACIYPGIYEPMPGKEKELKEQLNKKGVIVTKAPVNITEQTDHYKIEIVAPGFSREEQPNTETAFSSFICINPFTRLQTGMATSLFINPVSGKRKIKK